MNILLVDKGGTIKSIKIKDNNTEQLYKKCGIRNNKNFSCQAKWNVTLSGEKYYVQLWGRMEGKANMENKYDFPPPADNLLFFGTCCLARVDIDTGLLLNLTQEDWEKIYEKLFGGFEDIEEEEEESEDELASIPKELKTKSGYLKDNFVVDEDDNDDDDDVDETEDEIGELASIVEGNYSDDNTDEEDFDTDELDNDSGDDLQYEIYNYSDDD